MIGKLPDGVVSVLWFGIFPLISLVAGVLVLLRWKHAVTLSILVQLFQVPFLYTDAFLLNLGLPMNLTITGIWNARHGGSPTVLGINFLALGVLLLLLWCRSAIRDVPVTDAASNKALQLTARQHLSQVVLFLQPE